MSTVLARCARSYRGRKANVTVRFDGNPGVDVSDEIAQLVKQYGIVQNAKGEEWVTGHVYYQGERVLLDGKPVNSQDTLIKALDADPDLRAKLEAEVRQGIASEGRKAPTGDTSRDSIVEEDETEGIE